MAMDVVGLETLPEATMTGFADDDSISVWAKPYVASALRAGMVQGSGGDGDGAEFAPDRVITQTEAAVMLNRLLQVSDVAATGALSQDAAPAWAYQSVVNLEAVGVLNPEEDGSLSLNPDGTAFQRRVWQSLCDIPYGRVISYRELAAQVGSPRAFQAVGQANGRNPLPILIPCHRVIAADGTLGGYSSGVERKRFLLRLEGLSIPESKPPRRVGKRGVRAR